MMKLAIALFALGCCAMVAVMMFACAKASSDAEKAEELYLELHKN